MYNLPDIVDNDYSSGLNSKDAKDIIKIANSIWNDRSKARDKILHSMYDHYGIRNHNEAENLIKKTGKLSATKYAKHSIGRTKIRRLLGEFLEMGFDTNVYVTNKEGVSAKTEKFLDALTLSLSKPYIEMQRAMGLNPYSGIKIEEIGEGGDFDPKRFKLDVEIVIQILLNQAMTDQDLKFKLYSCLEKHLLSAETHGKVERLPDGSDTFRPINPLNMIFVEYDDDYFVEETPIKGERRFMTDGKILEYYGGKVDGLKQKIKDLQSGHNETNVYGQDQGSVNTTEYGYDVFIIQTKVYEPFYEKEIKSKDGFVKTFELSEKDYTSNKGQINYDVKKGKFKIRKFFRPAVYEITGIRGADFLLSCEKTESTVLYTGKNGKYYPKYDYLSVVTPRIGGERVSLQDLSSKIERIVDQTIYSIKREMSKPSGSALGINGSALPKGKVFADLMHQLSEHNLFEFETSGDRNASGEDIEGRDVFTNAQLGAMDKLRGLLEIKVEMERTLDNMTGINEAREGFAKATSTATTVNQNMSASRSATYEIFFLFGLFTRNMIVHLINKMKSNPMIINQENDSLLLGDMQLGTLKAIKDLILYDLGATITDGRRESEIMNQMKTFFEFELNAGTLRSEDVAKFLQSESFGKAIKAIEDARKEIEAVKQKENEQKMKEIETSEKGKTDRELNKQANELDKIVLKGASQQEIDDNKAMNESVIEDQSSKNKGIMEAEKRLAEKNPDGSVGASKNKNEFSEMEKF